MFTSTQEPGSGPWARQSASGELWIDAQTYLLQRAIWNIRNIPGTKRKHGCQYGYPACRAIMNKLPVSVPADTSMRLPMYGVCFTLFYHPRYFLNDGKATY